MCVIASFSISSNVGRRLNPKYVSVILHVMGYLLLGYFMDEVFIITSVLIIFCSLTLAPFLSAPSVLLNSSNN